MMMMQVQLHPGSCQDNRHGYNLEYMLLSVEAHALRLWGCAYNS